MKEYVDKTPTKSWNGYKVGDAVELAFSGQWLQDSTRFPEPNKYYWVEGKVIETYEKTCIVNCDSIGLNRVMVLDNEGIRHFK